VTTTTPAPSLRPRTLEEFSGQPGVTAELRIVLGGVRARGERVCTHMLFAGPPGLGKTTLAGIVAAELDLPMVTTAGPLLDKPGTLATLLMSLDQPTVVFIDEIHRIPLPVQEMLYSAMEDGRIDVVAGEGPGATVYPLQVEPFVLIGATTEAGRLARPFLDRFGYVGRLDLYDTTTLAGIVTRSADLLGMPITADAAAMVAARSRGTPRVANQLLGRVRDLASVTGADVIDTDLAGRALDVFGVDSAGLGKVDRRILHTLVTQFGGGPVGLTTLAAAVGEDPVTVEAYHEPYLLRSGLLRRTLRGRTATADTYTYLGLPVPAAFADDTGD
jgi:Holliday junction DNA helicase RuvB